MKDEGGRMKRVASIARPPDLWFSVLLAAVVLILYAPSLRFGLIWDDPRYYRTLVGQSSLWQILTSPQPPTYQFYRPMAVLYGRLLVSPEGIVNVTLANVLHVGMHLVVALTVAPILQALGLRAVHARLTALGFAVFPLSYQAVAWQQNQQPLMLMWALIAILAACQSCKLRSILLLTLSLAAYALALLVQEGALPFVLFFFWQALRESHVTGKRFEWWPLLHLGLALLYLSVWLAMPRQGSVTGRGFQSTVLGYLLQGLVFPVSSLSTSAVMDWPQVRLIVLFAAIAILVTVGVWKWESFHAIALIWAWIAVGLAPIWAGLSWAYVELGPRLLYPASVGIAALWAAWGAWAFSNGQPTWRRGLGGLIYMVVLIVSIWQWGQFQKLYQVGTQHLARAIAILAESPDSHTLFVNFPDRIELRPRPYPLGFWGLTLAPVAQDLADYALATVGRSGEDRTLSAFLVGADERQDWPYRVDMRGQDTSPEGLYQAALESDAVYLTHYRKDGTLDLAWVGSVRPAQSSQVMATLGDAARLVEAQAKVSASRGLTLQLTWASLKPLREHDTIFIHFWKDGQFVGEADGDSLGGLIPLLAWRPGTEIVDVRQVDVSGWQPGQYQVRVGIYNRVEETRYPAWRPGGQRFPDDEAAVLTFDLK